MSTRTERFLALDIFRGMTICFMIIVNTPGSDATAFAPLKHAGWFGFTPTDLVFPSFLFAVGNAQSFAVKKWVAISQKEIMGKIFRRTALIFLLGYLMYWFPFFKISDGHIVPFYFSQTRVWGVLQRIALTYCIASLMIYFLKEKWVVYIIVFILIAYWAVLYLGGSHGAYLSLQGNAVYRLDQYLLGNDHLYHGEGVPFDPEGLLSTFPAIGNVVAGYLTGKYLQDNPKEPYRLLSVAVLGFLLLCIAYFWNYAFPISKKLWTSPFTLLTVGLDMLIIIVIIYFAEIKAYNGKWTNFFIIPGKNPLVIYLFSELMAVIMFMVPAGNVSLYDWIFLHFFIGFSPYVGSLLQAIAFMFVCWCLGYLLDRRKIYIRI